MGKRREGQLRAMYAGGRGNATARRYARFWNWVLPLGLFPKRWVTLEVAGRKTGRATRFPLGMADIADQWYLVSMLGECNWVLNVRAASGEATLRRRGPHRVSLVLVPVDARPSVIKRYLEKVPGARPHIPTAYPDRPARASRGVRGHRREHSSIPCRPATAGMSCEFMVRPQSWGPWVQTVSIPST